MQQIVVETSRPKFLHEVNDLLMDGWRVVPGTTVIAWLSLVAFPDETKFQLPDGTTRVVQYSIVVERDDVR